MKKLRKLLFLLLLLLFVPVKIFAAGSITVNKSSLTLENAGSASFNITASNAAGKVTISSSNNSIVNVDKSSEWVENQTITVNVSAVSPGSTTIVVNVNAATFDEEKIIETYTINVVVNKPKSSNNNLKSLLIDGKEVGGFNVNTTSYNLGEISSGLINISAITEDSTAKISGIGVQNLNYGQNKLNVVVTAENGAKKTYSMFVTRPDTRSKDNSLSSLSVSPLNLKFNKNTTVYSFTVENSVKSITINAKASDTKATVSGVGTKTLRDYLNTFNIVVKAENGSKKTYTIKVIKKDADGNLGHVSKDNLLKELLIEGYTIEFDKEKLEYDIEVDNLIDNITVSAKTNDKTATYEVVGNTNFKVGKNKVKINVTAENGDVKIYVINVTRKGDAPTATLKDVETVLDKTTANQVIIELEDSDSVLDSKILEVFKKAKKNFVINKYDDDKLVYSWNINGSNIGDINSINTVIEFNSENEDKINELTNYADSMYLNFEHSGKLPEGTKVKISVKDKYKNDTNVNLYYYNEKTNKLEIIKQDIKVVDEYIEFELEHCSEYIITRSNINSNTYNWSLYVAIIEFIIIIGYVIYKKFIVSLNNKNKGMK